MPQYQFKCNRCDGVFEEYYLMKDAPSEAPCPACETSCQRYYGSMSFILKGDGWPSKNIRGGKAPTDTGKKNNNLSQAKNLDDVMNERQKAGLPIKDDRPMSDEEYKKRRSNIERFLDETEK